MNAPKKAALLWSGGKDSALALFHAQRFEPDLTIVKLVTCISAAYNRVSMHGVRRQLIEDQAAAIGLPVDFVVIPHQDDPPCPMAHIPGTTFPPNDVYSRTMLSVLKSLKDEGIGVIVFGDIFLEDVRAYRERLLAEVGLEGYYPLWGRDTTELYGEFTALGFLAVTVCVSTEHLRVEQCGQVLSAAFLESLPASVDACGERGEYHSFTFDGPPYRRPVLFTLGDLHYKMPFVFQELFPEGFAREGEPRLASVPTGAASA